jgi:dUTP pyrophosphatase
MSADNDAKIDDGFGDEPDPDLKQVDLIDISGLSDEDAEAVSKLTGEERAAYRRGLTGGASVRPVGKQADKLARGFQGPTPMNSEIELTLDNTKGRFNVDNKSALQQTEERIRAIVDENTGANIAELAERLVIAGWIKHPNIIDRWVAPNGVSVEMGYVHGEVWVRALETTEFGMGEEARKPLWTQRIYGYGTERSRARQDGIFFDLVQLACSDRRAQGPRLSEGHWAVTGNRYVNYPATDMDVPRRPLGFVLLTPDAKLPTRAYPDDAGFDLYVVEDTDVPANQFVDIPLGVSVGLPVGVWARITGRSSTLRNFNLLVNEGIIDTGYTGPLFAGVRNLGNTPKRIEAGTRIAQIILHDNVTERFDALAVDGHDETARGANGFGSSGS